MIDELSFKPTGYAYRVDDRVWAGEYPVWEYDGVAGKKELDMFLDFGIDCFFDLTEKGEMPQYECFLPVNAKRYTMPIPNGCVPASVRRLVDEFKRMDEMLSGNSGKRIYIHCKGGVGRTGTVVACYFVYFKGLPADEAIAEMRRRYAYHGRSAWMSAPETKGQCDFVAEFANSYGLYM